MKQIELMMNTKIEGSVDAVYRKTGVPSYDGNPLIECLPILGGPAEVIDRLNKFPKKVLCSSSPSERAAELTTALSNTFMGLPQHYDLAVFIDTKIKQGYFPRNPVLKQSPSLSQSNYEKMMSGDVVRSIPATNQFTSPPSGIIYGIAGGGKTSSFEHTLSFYPQVINHKDCGFTQITYLYINFPHDGRLHTLCKNFFNAINLASKKPNYNWLEKRETLDSMLAKMQAAVINYNIGILVIDEFQIWREKSKNSTEVIGFLISLINSIKVPIIFSGTPEAKGRLESNLALARRVSGFDVWDPLGVHSFESNRVEKTQLWDRFARKLWNYQYLSKPPVEFTEEINQAWFDCSQGIIDIAVKLYIQVQLRAIHSRKEEISAALIKHVYQRDFKSVHQIIDALRSGDHATLSSYPDLPQSEIALKIASMQQMIAKGNSRTIPSTLAPVAQDVLDLLVQIGYEQTVAKPAVEMVYSDNSDLDKKNLLALAIDILKAKDEEKPKATTGKKAIKVRTPPPTFDLSQQTGLFDKLVDGE